MDRVGQRQAFVHRVVEEMRSFDQEVSDTADLSEIARGLGVTIRGASLSEDGRIVSSTCQLTIELSRSRPLVRRRFTLAHELAHVMFWHQESRGLVDDEYLIAREEQICDEIANQLLIPDFVVHRFLESGRSELSIIRLVSECSRTSLSASTLALARVTQRRLALSSFRFHGGRWYEINSVNWPTGISSSRWLSPESKALVDELKDGDHDVTLRICTSTGDLHCTATISRSEDVAIALLRSWRASNSALRDNGWQGSHG